MRAFTLPLLFNSFLGATLFIWVSEANAAESPSAAARRLRRAFLTTPSTVRGTQESTDERVFGVAMDWAVGEGDIISTVTSLSDGRASLYTTAGLRITAGTAAEKARIAAQKFVADAAHYYGDSVETTNFSYPGIDRVRFFLLTRQGVRLIETDRESLQHTRGKYAGLFKSGQAVIAELRMTIQQIQADAQKGFQCYTDQRGPGLRAVTANGQVVTGTSREKKPWAADCLKMVAPEYPAWQREWHHQGSGLFNVIINPQTGRVTTVNVKRSAGFGALDKSAIKALRQWKWRPNKWSEIDIPVAFVLSKKLSPIPPNATHLPPQSH